MLVHRRGVGPHVDLDEALIARQDRIQVPVNLPWSPRVIERGRVSDSGIVARSASPITSF